MSYPSYPGYPGGMTPGPLRRPQSLITAVNLMFLGAAITLIAGIINAIEVNAVFGRVFAGFSTAGGPQPVPTFGLFAFMPFAVVVGLWLWMALASRAGQAYARVVSSVLFGLICLFLIPLFSPGFSLAKAIILATWLVGVGAIYYLWKSDSSEYFNRPRVYLTYPPAYPGYAPYGAYPPPVPGQGPYASPSPYPAAAPQYPAAPQAQYPVAPQAQYPVAPESPYFPAAAYPQAAPHSPAPAVPYSPATAQYQAAATQHPAPATQYPAPQAQAQYPAPQAQAQYPAPQAQAQYPAASQSPADAGPPVPSEGPADAESAPGDAPPSGRGWDPWGRF